MNKILVVGCGFSGIVISRLLTNLGYKCYIIDERNHIGGNCYSEKYNEDTDIHVYGVHIFHTSRKDVWDFVNKYDHFNQFTLNVKALAGDNKYYSLPFNMNTFYQIFGTTDGKEISNIIKKEIDEAGIKEPRNLEEQAISMVGKTIYELLIKEYTEKQWNNSCKNLDKNIIKRLPLRLSWNNNYYNDNYVGIPEHGYTTFMYNILNGLENEDPIEYSLNTQFTLNNIDEILMNYDYIIYTGQIDKLFDYKLGTLGWRSLNFDHKELLNTIENDQHCPVLNYTSHNQLYTRSIDHYYFNHIDNDYKDKTKIITYEYPEQYDKNKIAFYPINNKSNQKLQEQYIKLLKEKYPNIIPFGRLAEYQYLDMNDVVEKCFELIKMFN